MIGLLPDAMKPELMALKRTGSGVSWRSNWPGTHEL
jgi:hypothetical protein